MHGFQQTVTLADGTVLNGQAGLNETTGDLWVWLDETTDMTTAFTLFSNPQKTARITADLTPEVRETFTGYTVLNLIRQDLGKVSIRMQKGQ